MLLVILDILGLFCLAAFAFVVWPPAALLVVGVALLAMSYRAQRGDRA